MNGDAYHAVTEHVEGATWIGQNMMRYRNRSLDPESVQNGI
jgi:hypothetical protein